MTNEKYSDIELAKIAERYGIMWSAKEDGPFVPTGELIPEELYNLMRALITRSDPHIDYNK